MYPGPCPRWYNPGHDYEVFPTTRLHRMRRSCSVQQCGSACASPVAVRSAVAEPSMIAKIIRGETNASGAKKRICRSTLPSRLAISAKESTRYSPRSSTQLRAFAMAATNPSRLSELIVGHGDGECRMPLSSAGVVAEPLLDPE